MAVILSTAQAQLDDMRGLSSAQVAGSCVTSIDDGGVLFRLVDVLELVVKLEEVIEKESSGL